MSQVQDSDILVDYIEINEEYFEVILRKDIQKQFDYLTTITDQSVEIEHDFPTLIQVFNDNLIALNCLSETKAKIRLLLESNDITQLELLLDTAPAIKSSKERFVFYRLNGKELEQSLDCFVRSVQNLSPSDVKAIKKKLRLTDSDVANLRYYVSKLQPIDLFDPKSLPIIIECLNGIKKIGIPQIPV
jgi:hypothetical protein